MRRVPDQSIFAWGKLCMDLKPGEDLQKGLPRGSSHVVGWPLNGFSRSRCEDAGFSSLLARDLQRFTDTGNLKAVSHKDVLLRIGLPNLPIAEYNFSAHGIRTQLPLIPISRCIPGATDRWGTTLSSHFIVVLGCEHTHYPSQLLGRFCYIPPSEFGVDFLYSGVTRFNLPPESLCFYRLFPLSPATIRRCRRFIRPRMVYICHPERTTPSSRSRPYKAISLMLLGTSHADLGIEGYTVELRGPDRDHPATHWLTLSSAHHTIAVVF